MRSRTGGTAAILAAALVVVAACTGTTAPPPAPPTPDEPPALSGKLLGPLARSGGAEAAIVDLATGETVQVEGEELGDQSFLAGGVWASDGGAYLTVDRVVEVTSIFGGGRAVTRLVRVDADGTASVVGPEIVSGGTVLAERDGTVFALTCGRTPGILALRVDAPTEWRLVAEGCPAALSPDGMEAASVIRDETGTGIVVTTLADGRTREVARFDDIEELRTEVGLVDPPVLHVAWGHPGIAVVIGRQLPGGDRYGLVFLPDQGPPRVIALGSTIVEQIAWQPSGDLLALQQCGICERFRGDPHGEVRLFDAAGDSMLQVASSNQPFLGVSWSPDGRTLLAAVAEDEVLVLDATGATLGRRDVPVGPWAWSA